MQRFLESIKLDRGKIDLLSLHQSRIASTFEKHYTGQSPWKLKEILNNIHLPTEGWYKIRIVYDAETYSIDLFPYSPKNIQYLKVVTVSDNFYPFKYEDRSRLNSLLKKKGRADDVLISLNGHISDTSYANVILEKKGKLYTPLKPLLPGVQRKALLDKMSIEKTDIAVADIPAFDRLYLINALLPLGKTPPIPISRIYLPKSN